MNIQKTFKTSFAMTLLILAPSVIAGELDGCWRRVKIESVRINQTEKPSKVSCYEQFSGERNLVNCNGEETVYENLYLSKQGRNSIREVFTYKKDRPPRPLTEFAESVSVSRRGSQVILFFDLRYKQMGDVIGMNHELEAAPKEVCNALFAFVPSTRPPIPSERPGKPNAPAAETAATATLASTETRIKGRGPASFSEVRNACSHIVDTANTYGVGNNPIKGVIEVEFLSSVDSDELPGGRLAFGKGKVTPVKFDVQITDSIRTIIPTYVWKDAFGSIKCTRG